MVPSLTDAYTELERNPKNAAAWYDATRALVRLGLAEDAASAYRAGCGLEAAHPSADLALVEMAWLDGARWRAGGPTTFEVPPALRAHTPEAQLNALRIHAERMGPQTMDGVRLRAFCIGAQGQGIDALERESRDGLVSVVFPNLNGFPHVRRTMQSLRETTQGPIEVIAVDNGSTDGSREWLLEQRDITVLSMHTNLGAPTARNRGLAHVNGEYVLFCDNDVVFTPDWRNRLLRHMVAWPDIGIVAPMSDVVTGPQLVKDAPDFESVDLNAWADRFHAEHDGKHSYSLRLVSLCILVRRAVLEQIGGFDERFNPWGFEDDDLSLRTRIAGWALRIANDTFIQHLGSRTAKSASINYNALLLRNWERFKDKYGLPMDREYGSYPAEEMVNRDFDPRRDVVELG